MLQQLKRLVINIRPRLSMSFANLEAVFLACVLESSVVVFLIIPKIATVLF